MLGDVCLSVAATHIKMTCFFLNKNVFGKENAKSFKNLNKFRDHERYNLTFESSR